ncbi:AsmA-like C-terminal domain-containing protein, partial [Pelagibacteraceae bacterium]|nr:AsmA-like C-terminal domain-containing protein [Pelagibacteraceae bacterium]
IKGKTNINGSMSNVSVFINNLNIMTAHIDTNAKASSFNFLKNFNYLKSGTNKLNIIITKDLKSKNWIADVKSDVFASDINLDFIDYKKPANTRGNLTATFFFSGNKITKINKLNFFTDNIIMKGSLYFDDNIKIKKIKLVEYIYDKNNFSASIDYSKNDSRTIKVDGASIDLINFIKSNNKNLNNSIFSLNIEKLFYGDKFLGEASLNAKTKNSILEGIEGKLFYNSKPYVHFNDIAYEDVKFKKVLFKIDDLGLLLKEIKLSESFIKGNADIFIILDKENFNIQSGSINISDSSVKNASFLARLLQLASFTGLLEILTNEGIPFNKIVGDFSVNNKVVNINNLKLKGFSLGGTVKGNINLNNEIINLEGVIVPAYAINSLINKIPIVGQIITGIEGEGLIGVNYKARGTIDKPSYNINPLSILTPGILRNVFDVFKADESETIK